MGEVIVILFCVFFGIERIFVGIFFVFEDMLICVFLKGCGLEFVNVFFWCNFFGDGC